MWIKIGQFSKIFNTCISWIWFFYSVDPTNFFNLRMVLHLGILYTNHTSILRISTRIALLRHPTSNHPSSLPCSPLTTRSLGKRDQLPGRRMSKRWPNLRSTCSSHTSHVGRSLFFQLPRHVSRILWWRRKLALRWKIRLCMVFPRCIHRRRSFIRLFS